MPYAPQALYDYNDLMQQMLATNAQYLGWSVTIILATGLGSFLFAVKPLQKLTSNLSKEVLTHELKMQKLLDDNKKLRLEIRRLVQKSITTIDNKVAETEDTLKSKVDSVNVTVRETSTQLAQLEERMKGEIAKLEWYTQWYAHHTWDTKGIKVNVLSSLNSALRKANFNNEFQKLTLETLRDFLKEIPSDHDLTIHRKSWTSHLNNLENISRTISGHQEVLEQIRNSATSIKNKLTTLPEVAEQQT